jgi:hypothetical protein
LQITRQRGQPRWRVLLLITLHSELSACVEHEVLQIHGLLAAIRGQCTFREATTLA